MKATLANLAWLASSAPAWLRFRRALAHPEQTQRALLRRLVARNAASAYGRAHGFGTLRTYEDFRERVPIIDYEALEPWITRLRQGEPAVLTTEPVTRLLPTSGSSGARKLIPFTASFQRELNAAIGPWMLDLCRQHPVIALGPAYWSISPALPAGDEPSAVPIGFDDDSAYVGGLRRHLVEAAFAAPSVLRLVSDVETSRYLTLLCLLRQPSLRLVSVWHPSFLSLLLETLPRWWEELLRDVREGGCQRAAALPTEVRCVMHRPAQPQRAALLQHHGPHDAHALWPHWRVVSCWGDAQAAPAARELQRRLPHVSVQAKGLLATEAFVSIPFAGRHPVAVTSHLYEFANPQGRLYLTHELQAGETYEVIVTMGGGLWRYRMSDLVEVDGFVQSTPSLRFLGRGASVSDLCGEKLSEPFVTRALASLNLTSPFAMLAPEKESSARPHYTLFLEGDLPPGLPARLDSALRENPHYALCRDLNQLGAPHCFPIPADAYEQYTRACLAFGERLGNIKPRALSQREDWRQHFYLPLTP